MHTRYGNGFVNVRAINPKVSYTSHAKIRLYVTRKQSSSFFCIDISCDFVSIWCFWIFDFNCGPPSTFPVLCQSITFSNVWNWKSRSLLIYRMFQRSFPSRRDVSQLYIDDSMWDRMEMGNVNDRYSHTLLSIISQWQPKPKDLR